MVVDHLLSYLQMVPLLHLLAAIDVTGVTLRTFERLARNPVKQIVTFFA